MFTKRAYNPLKKGVTYWNKWRSQNFITTIDFAGANLSGAKLMGIDFRGVNLRGANLIKIDLTHANLDGVDLSYANLTKANLIGASLIGANLTGASLIEANYRNAELTGSTLSLADLTQSDLRVVNFSSAELIGANLTQANLSGANFSSANLIRANLSQANLSQADLLDANLSQANLSQADLSRADLSRANLFKGNLSNAILVETQALFTNFKQSVLTGACLEKIKINRQTCFQNVICDRIYLKYSEQQSPQKPKSQNLTSREFSEIINSLIGSVDLFFENNIDWFVFLLTLQKIEVQYNIKKIYIREIEYIRKNSLKINVVIAANFDRSRFIQCFWHKYRLIMSAKGKLIKKPDLTHKIKTEIYRIDPKYQEKHLEFDIASG